MNSAKLRPTRTAWQDVAWRVARQAGSATGRSVARRLIRSGEFARAFAAAPDDVEIAIRLGLFFTAVEQIRNQKDVPDALCIEALLGAGRYEEAIARLDRSTWIRPSEKRRLAVALAAIAPERALAFVDHDQPFEAALKMRISDETPSLIPEEDSVECYLALAALHSRRGCAAGAAAAIGQAFISAGLEAPVARSLPLTTLSAECRAPVKQGPLISVVMPLCNVAPYVEASIRSILQQTWRNLEVIAVDDASDDETASIVQALADDDTRIRLFRRSSRGGAYVTRNEGLANATGDFITFQDGDDWAHPQRIEKLAEHVCTGRKIVAASASWVRMDLSGQPVSVHVWPLMRWHATSTLFRRQVLDEIGGFDPVMTGADSEFWARIVLHYGSWRTKRLRIPLTIGLWRNDSLTGSPSTGFDQRGFSAQRLAYREAWFARHVGTLLESRDASALSDRLPV